MKTLKTQFDLFDDGIITLASQMAVRYFHVYMELKALWDQAPQICDDDHKGQMHRADIQFQEYSRMSGCDPFQLLKHASKNNLLPSDDVFAYLYMYKYSD